MKCKNSKRQTIGKMTKSRGVMPPPTRAKESKKIYDRNRAKREM